MNVAERSNARFEQRQNPFKRVQCFGNFRFFADDSAKI